MYFKKMARSLLALALVLPGAAMCANALQPYVADYSLKMKGLSFGAKQSLVAEADGTWVYSLKASALRVGNVAESSTVLLNDGGVKTLSHSRVFKVLTRSKKLTHVFDGKTIKINEDGLQTTVAQKANVYDANSVLLQIRQDLLTKGMRPSYLLIDKHQLEDVAFKNHGTETITVRGKQYLTTKIERIHDDSERKTFFWLGNKQAYIAIKVQHIDHGDGYNLELKEIKLNPL